MIVEIGQSYQNYNYKSFKKYKQDFLELYIIQRKDNCLLF